MRFLYQINLIIFGLAALWPLQSFALSLNEIRQLDVITGVAQGPDGYPKLVIFSKVACTGLYNNHFNLSERLAQCPALENLLIWEDGHHNRTSYPGWTDQQKERLDDLFVKISDRVQDLGLDCPDPKRYLQWAQDLNNDGSVKWQRAGPLLFTENQAFDIYAAFVAHVLYLEINHLVPWSIFDHPPEELKDFFDSSRSYSAIDVPFQNNKYAMFGFPGSRLPPDGIIPGRDFQNSLNRKSATWEAVCDPRVGYEFIRGMKSSMGIDMVGNSEIETLKNLTWWFYHDVIHGNMPGDLPYGENTEDPAVVIHYTYLNDRLKLRTSFNRSKNKPVQIPPRVVSSFGCHSTANLFHDLAKSINIPVLHSHTIVGKNGEHGGLVYGWGGENPLYVEHSDDMNAEFVMIVPIDQNGTALLPLEDAVYFSLDAKTQDIRDYFFELTWKSSSVLANWEYALTGDFEPTNNGDIIVGNWGAPLSSYGESYAWTKFYWGESYALCATDQRLLGNYCHSPRRFASSLISIWTLDHGSGFKDNVLTVPIGALGHNGGVISSDEYDDRAQSCAKAYGNGDAFEGCNAIHSMIKSWQARKSQNFWIGR